MKHFKPTLGAVSDQEKKNNVFSTTLEMKEIAVQCKSKSVKKLSFGVMGLTKEVLASRKPIPCILGISGEAQQHVSRFFQSWKPEERGWVVITPLRPDKLGLFMEDDAALELIPQLVDHLRSLIQIEGNKVHVVGTSNGGTTSLIYAAMYPQDCASVAVVTGSLSRPAVKYLDNLKCMPVDVHCGEQDELGFLNAAHSIDNALKAMGHPKHTLSTYPRAGHFTIGEYVDKDKFFAALDSYRISAPPLPPA